MVSKFGRIAVVRYEMPGAEVIRIILAQDDPAFTAFPCWHQVMLLAHLAALQVHFCAGEGWIGRFLLPDVFCERLF